MGDENRAGLFMFGPGGLREEYLVARMVKHFGPRFGIWSLVWFSLAWYGTMVIWSHTAFTSCKAIGALPVGKLCLTKLYSDC